MVLSCITTSLNISTSTSHHSKTSFCNHLGLILSSSWKIQGKQTNRDWRRTFASDIYCVSKWKPLVKGIKVDWLWFSGSNSMPYIAAEVISSKGPQDNFWAVRLSLKPTWGKHEKLPSWKYQNVTEFYSKYWETFFPSHNNIITTIVQCSALV